VNHSCERTPFLRRPSCSVARTCYRPEEEITWDYSTAIDEEDFPGFACCCGAVACRGAVHSSAISIPIPERLRDWLLPYLREKYFP